MALRQGGIFVGRVLALRAARSRLAGSRPVIGESVGEALCLDGTDDRGIKRLLRARETGAQTNVSDGMRIRRNLRDINEILLKLPLDGPSQSSWVIP